MYKLKYFKTQGQNLHSTFENIKNQALTARNLYWVI